MYLFLYLYIQFIRIKRQCEENFEKDVRKKMLLYRKK